MNPPDLAPGTRAIVSYLGLPAILFLLTFVRPLIGLPVLALLLAAGWYVWRTPTSPGLWAPPIAGALLIALLTGFPSGPYTWDWIKHWALIGELSEHPWPLVIELKGEPSYLRYYLGAYLVPALFHRIIPQIPIWVPTFLWFGLGCALLFRSIATLAMSASQRWLAILLFLALGGADVYAQLGYRTMIGFSTPLLPLLGLHNENWMFYTMGIPLEYSSFMTALAWVPHQAIATFLATLLLVTPPERRSFPAAVLVFGLLALWSPYGMIGLLPLLLAVIWQHRAEVFARGSLLTAVAGASFALIVAWYLSTDIPTGGACFSCVPTRLGQFGELLPFLLFELAPFALILGRKLLSDIACRTALLVLLVLPLTYGEFGDFVMRASLGPLLVLALASISTLFEDWSARRRLATHALALVLCVPGTMSEAIYLRTEGLAHHSLPDSDPLNTRWMGAFTQSDRVTAVEYFDFCGWKYVPQYFTRKRPAMLRERAEAE